MPPLLLRAAARRHTRYYALILFFVVVIIDDITILRDVFAAAALRCCADMKRATLYYDIQLCAPRYATAYDDAERLAMKILFTKICRYMLFEL